MKGDEGGVAQENVGDGLGEGDGAAGAFGEEMAHHLEALVVEGDLAGHIGSVDENVKVVAGGPRLFGVVPGFGIVVETEHEVGLDDLVDEVGAGADFGGAVEEFFGSVAVAESWG